MLLIQLREYKNENMPKANGKFFAYPVITETKDIDDLSDHMASHNTPFSKGAIKGMLTDMVVCVKELALQGYAIKIDDLAIFSIGIKNQEGAASEKEFSVAKNIEGFKLRARATGEFRGVNIDANIRRVDSLLGSDTTTADGGGSNTPSGGGNPPSGGGSSEGGTTPGGGSGSDTGDSGSGGGVVSE